MQDGDHTVLLGVNGSGKTALLQVITGYMTPSAGEVEVMGFRRGRSDVRELRRRIGWVSTALAERIHSRDTALEVVASGRFASIGLWEPPAAEDYAAAERELAFMGCEALADRRYAVLSQGEKQRVLIARALVSRPRLLVLDEPASGLDPAAREHVLSYVEKLGQTHPGRGLTLLYVTHHIEEIRPVFARTSVMKGGRLFADGPTADVVTSSVLSEAYDFSMVVERRGERFYSRPA